MSNTKHFIAAFCLGAFVCFWVIVGIGHMVSGAISDDCMHIGRTYINGHAFQCKELTEPRKAAINHDKHPTPRK